MMRQPRLLGAMVAGLLSIAFLLPLGCAGSPELPPLVVVVCVEGLRFDYPDRADTPTLDRLAAEGGRAARMLPVFPANSMPNLAALSTGRLPAASGLVNNRLYDPDLRQAFEAKPGEAEALFLAETIWAAAERQGIASGGINWYGAGAGYTGGATSWNSTLDDEAGDEARAAEAASAIAGRHAVTPQLLLVYLDELDDVAHRRGPDSPATLEAVERVDRLLARILTALDRRGGNATLIVVGDHGMAPVERCVFLIPYLEELGLYGTPMGSGATANIYLPPGADPRIVQASMRSDSELFTAYLAGELPAELDYRGSGRIGDLVLVARPGIYFRDRGERPVGPALLPGAHGGKPSRPEMQSAFFAWGRGVTAGRRWESLDILDIHPTVSRLLGIESARKPDGAPIPGIDPPPEHPAP